MHNNLLHLAYLTLICDDLMYFINIDFVKSLIRLEIDIKLKDLVRDLRW